MFNPFNFIKSIIDKKRGYKIVYPIESITLKQGVVLHRYDAINCWNNTWEKGSIKLPMYENKLIQVTCCMDNDIIDKNHIIDVCERLLDIFLAYKDEDRLILTPYVFEHFKEIIAISNDPKFISETTIDAIWDLCKPDQLHLQEYQNREYVTLSFEVEWMEGYYLNFVFRDGKDLISVDIYGDVDESQGVILSL